MSRGARRHRLGLHTERNADRDGADRVGEVVQLAEAELELRLAERGDDLARIRSPSIA